MLFRFNFLASRFETLQQTTYFANIIFKNKNDNCKPLLALSFFYHMAIGVWPTFSRWDAVVPAFMLCTSKYPTRCSATLFRKKRFMLDEKFQRNVSKFAIFYIYENPKLFFLFFFFCYLIFPLMNVLVYVNKDQGIH